MKGKLRAFGGVGGQCKPSGGWGTAGTWVLRMASENEGKEEGWCEIPGHPAAQCLQLLPQNLLPQHGGRLPSMLEGSSFQDQVACWPLFFQLTTLAFTLQLPRHAAPPSHPLKPHYVCTGLHSTPHQPLAEVQDRRGKGWREGHQLLP